MNDWESVQMYAMYFLIVVLFAVMALLILAVLLMLPLIGIAVCIAFTPWLGVPLTTLLSLVSIAIGVLLVGVIKDEME